MRLDSRQLIKKNSFLMLIIRIFRGLRRFIRSLDSSKSIDDYLGSHRVRKLQVGSGSNLLDGWLNTDYSLVSRNTVFLDATKRFHFPDDTLDYVFSEHQFENLTYPDGLHMLSECFRVLKPGGRIRVATTNLEAIIGLYCSSESCSGQDYIDWVVNNCFADIGIYRSIFVVNNAFCNWNHRFLYDQETLKLAFEAVGFTGVVKYEYGQSECEHLRGIESTGKILEGEKIRRFDTMVLEAEVPYSIG